MSQAGAVTASFVWAENREIASFSRGHTANKYCNQNLTINFLAPELTSVAMKVFHRGDYVLFVGACQLWSLPSVHLWDLGWCPEAGRHQDRVTDWPTSGRVIPKYFQPTGKHSRAATHQARKSFTGQFSQDNLLSGLRKGPAGHSPRTFSLAPLFFVTPWA